MAASTFVPARHLRVPSSQRRSGGGSAPVIPLFASTGRVASVDLPAVDLPALAPTLRLVASRRMSRPRMVLAAIAATLLIALVLGLGVAVANPAVPAIDGHVVLQPGETLWDVAVRSAPPGVDASRQLADIRAVNDFGRGALDAWTVVLLPAR